MKLLLFLIGLIVGAFIGFIMAALLSANECSNDKDTPKKVLEITYGYDGDYGFCPNCKKPIADYKEYKRCSGCGQLLTWK